MLLSIMTPNGSTAPPTSPPPASAPLPPAATGTVKVGPGRPDRRRLAESIQISPSDSNWEDALNSALNVSSATRLVLLDQGTYLLTSQLSISGDKNVTALVAGTVALDAQGMSRVLEIATGEVVLSGLNITNGGIYVSDATATITDCNIHNNTATYVRSLTASNVELCPRTFLSPMPLM